MSIAEKLTTIAENEQKVYEAGKKSQYDEFWDNHQQNGKRTDYTGGFSGWNGNIFKPKYNMQPIAAVYMLAQFTSETDLVEHLDNLGITLDFSKCTNFTNFMLWGQITRMGVIDSTAATAISFYYAYKMRTLDLLIIRDDGSTTLTFEGAENLTNITIQGVIGKSTNMRWSPLSKNSITNVISVLSDTTTNLTLTLSKSAVNKAFSNEDWETLVATKPNWTISLI